MAAAAKVTQLRWDADHLAALQPVVDANPFGPLSGPLNVFGGSYLYEFTQARQHALVAVRPVPLQFGTRLDVVGLLSDGERLQADALAGALDVIANGHQADLLAMCTNSGHIVKRCARHGWAINGVVMIKGLDHVRQ